MGLDALGLAFEGERVDAFGLDCPARETASLLADQDLVRLCSLLEAGGDVDRVACCQPLLGTGDHLSGVDSGPHPQRDAVVALEFLVERAERVAELRCGAYRAQGIVLADRRYAEDGHDRVADELLERSAVPLDCQARHVEVTRHHASQGLRVELLAERRRAGDVREEDRHGLADLPPHG